MTAYKQPAQWTHALGNNADVSKLPDDTAGTTGLASLQKLFQLINQTPLAAGGVAPSREDFNALFKLLGESVFYMQNGGVWTYNNKYDYKVGRVVLHTDGNLYKCIKDNGVSSAVKAPTDTTYWTKLSTQIDVAAVDAKTATNKQDIAAIKSNYVTTNSQQNITALKIFETSSGNPIHFKDTRFERAKAPSADIFNTVNFTDKNNANLGYMQICQRKNSDNALYLCANRDKNGQSDGIALGLIIPRDTTKAGYATAPSTPSSATANEIATAKFVNDKISAVTTGYVTTDTAQTITGKKTLTTTNKSVVTKIKITNNDNTVTPTETLWTDVISVCDKNTKNAGALQFSRQSDGMNWVKLQAVNQQTNGRDTFKVIGIGIKSDGTASTSAPKPASNSNDSSIATTEWVNTKISANQANVPTGAIIPFAGSNIPAGYLLCNGAAVSRTTYANLFGVISTLYGAGDGSATFNLPDLRDRFLEGAGTNAVGTKLEAGLPNIMGDWRTMYSSREDATTVGAAYFYFNDAEYLTALTAAPNNKGLTDIMFYADRSNAIYGASGTVQPKALNVQYLIKY